MSEENSRYASKDYWNSRFGEEEEKDWLATWRDLEPEFLPILQAVGGGAKDGRVRVLVVGCGNATLSADLARLSDPPCVVTSMDYSSVVVAKMAERHPELEWITADLTCCADRGQPLAGRTFDVIIDKGTLDAIEADGGSHYDPAAETVARMSAAVASCAAMLAPGGLFVSITFSPVQFRSRYLVGEPRADTKPSLPRWVPGLRWTVESPRTVRAGLGYPLFICQRPGGPGPRPRGVSTTTKVVAVAAVAALVLGVFLWSRRQQQATAATTTTTTTTTTAATTTS